MSWFLIAGSLVEKLERYKSLSTDTKYLFKQYIQEKVNGEFYRQQHRGALKALQNMHRRLNEVLPTDQEVAFCWYCGELEFPSKTRTLEDMGWLQNMRVIYSGHLCLTCQKDPKLVAYFLNDHRDLDATIRQIADYGCHMTPELKDKIKDYSFTEEERQSAITKVSKWLRKLWDGGHPYGGAPEDLDA